MAQVGVLRVVVAALPLDQRGKVGQVDLNAVLPQGRKADVFVF